jgi:hypothetical protein
MSQCTKVMSHSTESIKEICTAGIVTLNEDIITFYKKVFLYLYNRYCHTVQKVLSHSTIKYLGNLYSRYCHILHQVYRKSVQQVLSHCTEDIVTFYKKVFRKSAQQVLSHCTEGIVTFYHGKY